MSKIKQRAISVLVARAAVYQQKSDSGCRAATTLVDLSEVFLSFTIVPEDFIYRMIVKPKLIVEIKKMIDMNKIIVKIKQKNIQQFSYL